MLAASAAFRVVSNPTAAADFVGAMLTRWHYIALAAPLLLFAIELRRMRRLVLVALFAGVLLAAAQGFVDLRIRAIRWSSPVPISALPQQHPVRRSFGALHGISMGLLLLQAIVAACVVGAKPYRREEKHFMSSWADRDDEATYAVVRNHEDQYSIWPADRDLPPGWDTAGKTGSRKECLDHIGEVWLDRRPLSLRRMMDEQG